MKSRNETTSPRVASAASRVLHDARATKAEKSAAGSALAQVRGNESTHARAASNASHVLRDPRATAAQKSAAGSTLTQVKKK